MRLGEDLEASIGVSLLLVVFDIESEAFSFASEGGVVLATLAAGRHCVAGVVGLEVKDASGVVGADSALVLAVRSHGGRLGRGRK